MIKATFIKIYKNGAKHFTTSPKHFVGSGLMPDKFYYDLFFNNALNAHIRGSFDRDSFESNLSYHQGYEDITKKEWKEHSKKIIEKMNR